MTLRLIAPTLLFYALAFTFVFVLEKFSPSGPCTPGLGLLSFFLLIPIIFGLLIKNLYVTIKKTRQNVSIVILHAVAIIVLFVIIC